MITIWNRLSKHMASSYKQLIVVILLVCFGAVVASLLPWPMKLIVVSLENNCMSNLPYPISQVCLDDDRHRTG